MNLLWGLFDGGFAMLLDPPPLTAELAIAGPSQSPRQAFALEMPVESAESHMVFTAPEPAPARAAPPESSAEPEPARPWFANDLDEWFERAMEQAKAARGRFANPLASGLPSFSAGSQSLAAGGSGQELPSDGSDGGTASFAGSGGIDLGGDGGGEILFPPGAGGPGGGLPGGGAGPSGPDSGGGTDAVDDEAITDEDTAVNIYYILYKDTDPELDTLVIIGITQPANGSAVLELDQTVTYTPAANWSGLDSFTYTVTDGNGNYDTATVAVTVDAVNDAPVADSQSLAINEDTPLSISFTGSDVENQELSFVVFDAPARFQKLLREVDAGAKP